MRGMTVPRNDPSSKPESDPSDHAGRAPQKTAAPTALSEIVDTPGVHIPPPLIAAVILLFGLWINAENNWSFLGPRHVVTVLGVLAALKTLSLIYMCFRYYHRHQTSILPHTPDSDLITDGLFSYSRNPVYLALGLGYAAATLLLDAPFALALLPVLMYVLHRYVVPREEAYLLRRFGPRYMAYMRQTPRWMFFK